MKNLFASFCGMYASGILITGNEEVLALILAMIGMFSIVTNIRDEWHRTDLDKVRAENIRLRSYTERLGGEL